MNVPIKWLKDFVDINVSVEELCDALTMSGSKVESIERPGSEISNVVVGKILSIEKHPDADKLVVTKVDTGKDTLQIVTGASNISEGDYIPVALHGSTLPGGIKMLSVQEIWSNVEKLLETELTRISLDTWIKTAKPLHINQDIFTIEAPSEFNRDILKTRYIPLITNAIKTVTNKKYQIKSQEQGKRVVKT